MNKMPKNAENFICETCNFVCSKKSNYDIHLLTAKHQNRTIKNALIQKNAKVFLFYCKKCNKGYNAKNSLWYHEKKCNINEILEDETDSEITTNNNKDELIQYLINENKEFKNLILEFVKKDNSSISINNVTRMSS